MDHIENQDQLTDVDDPEFRRVVENLTIQALREYDDGPLTPPQPRSDRSESQVPRETENENQEDNNLVVLDPDHPLMQPFQKKLKEYLQKREQSLTLEARETKYQLEKAKREREEFGVSLYGMQQELARHQMLMEKEHDKYNDTNENRKMVETELENTRNTYRLNQTLMEEELKKVRDLQQERDNLKIKIHYISTAKEDIRGDIAVIRRATEKAEMDKSKFEVEKQRLDLIVNQLEEKESKLREDIGLYESQLHNQMKESKATKDALIEARMETEAIEKEKNQLMQNWSSCLIGMKRRDEAHAQMNLAIKAQKQKFDSTISEIESYKKSIIKEQEKNESLTIMINHRKLETKNIDKSLKFNKDKTDLLQQEYNAFNRALKETESALNNVNNEKLQKMSFLNQQQREIELINQEKVKLEDEIFKKIQTKLTAEKAAQYSDKLRKEQREKLRELERTFAKIENDIAKARLESVETKSFNEALSRDVKVLQNEINDKNRIITKSESEIRQRVLLIEHKQGQIDLYNKKIEYLIEKAGGIELGPLELEEKNLTKEIDDVIFKIMELEQKWLREQNELVKLVGDKQKKQHECMNQKDNYIILTTKKMRIEKTIENEQSSIKNLNKNLDSLRLQLEKLNKYIYKEFETKVGLEKKLALNANDVEERMKRAEIESIGLQNSISQTAIEKEKLLADLIDTDEQIMVWEKRIKIAKEMKNAVDSEAGQGEIKEMKFEIHRMKVRHSELMKQQERLVRELETCVVRRDKIVTRGEFTQKNPAIVTQGKLQREVVDLQKKIKETSREINTIDSELRLLKDKQQQLARLLDDKQKDLHSLGEQDELKNANLEMLLKQKQENMDELLMKQRRAKYYEKLKEGKYVMLFKKEDQNERESAKQLDKLRSMSSIVLKLIEEYPNLQVIIRKVDDSIQSRLNQEELSSEK